MKRGLKKKSGIYAYLEACGALDKNAEEIQIAKKEYWALYRRNWRKRKANEQKSFVVFLNAQEFHIVKEAARKHRRSITAFLKQATLSYVNQIFLVPDLLTVNAIKELLIMTYAGVLTLLDENVMSYIESREIKNRLGLIEATLTDLLQNPVLIEDRIKQEIHTKPEYRKELLSWLEKLQV